MHRLRRRSARHRCFRPAKIQLEGGALPRDCLAIDISNRGVRLNVEGLDVPEEFVLLLSKDGVVQKSTCKVVWRFGNELGAKFINVIRPPGFAERDKPFMFEHFRPRSY